MTLLFWPLLQRKHLTNGTERWMDGYGYGWLVGYKCIGPIEEMTPTWPPT
jgi:hypothetical protein